MSQPTTKEVISRWFDEGVADGDTHMIVVCDTFEWEDYPVYVSPTQDVKKEYQKYDGVNMQTIKEVYSLKKNKEEQLSEYRAVHLD